MSGGISCLLLIRGEVLLISNGQRSWMLLNTGQLPQQGIYPKTSVVPCWEMSTQFALHQHNLEGESYYHTSPKNQ